MVDERESMAHDQGPEPETLRAQLQVLNARANWYASQAWHVPFAYAAIVASVAALKQDAAWWPLALLGVPSTILVWIANARLLVAVNGIRETQSKLRLDSNTAHGAVRVPAIDWTLVALVISVAAYCAWRACHA